ncbi:MAG: CBS domain-containing protein [Thermotaleaceae bacterium]
MNVAFFITPKQDTIYILENATIRQAIEKMEYHGYSAVPIINEKGKYISTLTEGDLLKQVKKMPDKTLQEIGKLPLREVEKHVKNRAVSINANIEDLILLITNQNFVPVIDDDRTFIGIVKRSTIINYFYQMQYKEGKELKRVEG